MVETHGIRFCDYCEVEFTSQYIRMYGKPLHIGFLHSNKELLDLWCCKNCASLNGIVDAYKDDDEC